MISKQNPFMLLILTEWILATSMEPWEEDVWTQFHTWQLLTTANHKIIKKFMASPKWNHQTIESEIKQTIGVTYNKPRMLVTKIGFELLIELNSNDILHETILLARLKRVTYMY